MTIMHFFSIPDPGFNLVIFEQVKIGLESEIWDLGKIYPGSGSSGQNSTGSRIRIRNSVKILIFILLFV